MYLDTKNLSNTAATTTATTTSRMLPKPARGMRKVWQPLRRLLTVGGKGRPMPQQPHPNNVDLNNTQQQPQMLPQLLLPEDNNSKIVTLVPESCHKLLQEELTQTPPPPNTPTLISSVYVEKFSTQSCHACPHGRNCQHTHHNTNISSNNSNSVAPPLYDLQYISTDNGTFFWANTQERVDDDLLHAWLCQSFSQLPGTLC